jgi:pullulanase
MVVYELHVRDFSHRRCERAAGASRAGTSAFTHAAAHGMRHLRALAQAGMTDVHLLPVFDIASVPEPAAPRRPCPKPRPTARRSRPR